MWPAPGDSPTPGLDTLYQKGHIGSLMRTADSPTWKRRGGSLLAKFKIQNLAAGSGQILNFEFCGVGSQSVAVVALRRSPPSRRIAGGGSRLAKFKIQNLAAGSDQISNFEFCGVGSQSSPSSRRVGRRRRVEARGRKPTCKIQNSKFGRGERPNFEF